MPPKTPDRADHQTAPLPAWLQSAWLWPLAMALAMVPLVLPPVAPLTDLGGHLGHFAVQVDHGRSADLARWYGFRWNLIPNLGVDLLMEALAPVFGLEPALRLVAAAIPALQVLALLCLSRTLHGRITPLALCAVPLAYCYPLQFGFLNFALGQALAMLALALWIHLGRRGAFVARWALFVPLACLLWTCHLVAWALLCAFAGMDELARRWPRGARLLPALWPTALATSCLLAPQVVRVVCALPPGGHGPTGDFFNPALKLTYLLMPLRDRWLAWDVAGAALLLALVGWSLRRADADAAARAGTRGLWWGCAALGVVYLLLPATLIGASLVDMRLVPFVLMVALVAATPRYRGRLSWSRLAVLAAGFAGLRLLGNALSLWLAGQAMAADLVALDAVPRGSRVASLVLEQCTVSILPWQRERRVHLGGYAVARRHAFSNEQWIVPGGHLLQIRAPLAGSFASDDSQLAKPDDCDKPNAMSRRLAALPRAAFDYLWIIDQGVPRAVPGWQPLLRTPGSVLYRKAP